MDHPMELSLCFLIYMLAINEKFGKIVLDYKQ